MSVYTKKRDLPTYPEPPKKAYLLVRGRYIAVTHQLRALQTRLPTYPQRQTGINGYPYCTRQGAEDLAGFGTGGG